MHRNDIVTQDVQRVESVNNRSACISRSVDFIRKAAPDVLPGTSFEIWALDPHCTLTRTVTLTLR